MASYSAKRLPGATRVRGSAGGRRPILWTMPAHEHFAVEVDGLEKRYPKAAAKRVRLQEG